MQPTELLTRRPDIRGAEARIEAANGNVARAAFIPQIRLSADSFFDLASSGGIINPGGSLSAGSLATIFDRGRLRGRLVRARGEQYEAVASYRKAVLAALTETRNTLSISRESEARLTAFQRSRAEALQTAKLARLQYAEASRRLTPFSKPSADC